MDKRRIASLATQGSLFMLMGALILGTLWSGGYFPVPKWTLAAMLIGAGLWEVVSTAVSRQARLLRSPALWIFLAFAAFAVTSLAWTEVAAQTRREAVLMTGYLAALLVARSQISRFGATAATKLLRWLVYAAGFAAAWGVFTYLLRIYPYVTLVDLFLRAGSTFEYSNALSCFELMALPVTLAFFQDGAKDERPLFATAAAMQMAAVALSFSRLGLVLLAAMAVYFLAVARRRGLVPEIVLTVLTGLIMAAAALVLGEAEYGKTGVAAVSALAVLSYLGQVYTAGGRSVFKKVFLAAAILGGIAMALPVAISGRAQLIIRSRFGEGLAFDTLLPHRQLAWDSAFQALQDKPIRGWGLGSFYVIFFRYQEAQFTKFAHNLVLQVAADTGLIGAALLILFLGYVTVLSFWRLLGRFNLTGRAVAISVLVFIIYNIFDWEWYIPALTAWFLVIIACLEAENEWGARDNP